MTLRRELISYLGTGAIGGMIGYYAGAQQLLGIQSERGPAVSDQDGSAEGLTAEPTRESTQEPTRESTQEPTRESTQEPTQESTQEPTQESTQEPTEDSSGAVVLDDFEETDQLEWSIDQGDRSRIEFTELAARGTYSLHFVRDSEDVSTHISREIEPIQMSEFSLWFQYESSNDNNFRVELRNDSGDKLQEFREFSGQMHYRDPDGEYIPHNEIARVAQNEWYQLVVTNIDFANRTLSGSVYNQAGENIGNITGINFLNDVDTISRVTIKNGLGNNGNPDPLWIDHVQYRF